MRRAVFVTRPRLLLEHGPPPRPPWRRGYGSYCLQATCDMRDGGGCLVGRVVGYDRYVQIKDTVEHACRIQAHGTPGATCDPARLMMLRERKECAGEVFFVFDGSARRVL